MKKNLKIINVFIASAISLCMLGGCGSSMVNTDGIPKEIVQVLKAGQNKNGNSTSYYYYDATEDGHKSVRSDVLTSDYYIFAGNKSEEEANRLISELNMMDKVQEWGSRVYVINPINSAEYTDEDREALIDLVDVGIRNVKVIGIDEGATFVNNNITKSCYFIAGIMTYGGKIDENLSKNDVVPAYLSNADKKAQEFYIEINEATEKEKHDKYTIYRNKGRAMPFKL